MSNTEVHSKMTYIFKQSKELSTRTKTQLTRLN